MFNCSQVKRLTFARRKFFKIVLAQSGESVTSIFFADMDSDSRLMFKVLVGELPVLCIFDMRNTGFFLFDSLFFEFTLSWCQLDLDKKFERFSAKTIRIEMKITFIQILIGINGFAMGYAWQTSLHAHQLQAVIYFRCFVI